MNSAPPNCGSKTHVDGRRGQVKRTCTHCITCVPCPTEKKISSRPSHPNSICLATRKLSTCQSNTFLPLGMTGGGVLGPRRVQNSTQLWVWPSRGVGSGKPTLITNAEKASLSRREGSRDSSEWRTPRMMRQNRCHTSWVSEVSIKRAKTIKVRNFVNWFTTRECAKISDDCHHIIKRLPLNHSIVFFYTLYQSTQHFHSMGWTTDSS